MPQVRVRRDGKELDLPATGLVPGHRVLWEARWIVPAGLPHTGGFTQGESQAVNMQAASLSDLSLPIGDRANMAGRVPSSVVPRAWD